MSTSARATAAGAGAFSGWRGANNPPHVTAATASATAAAAVDAATAALVFNRKEVADLDVFTGLGAGRVQPRVRATVSTFQQQSRRP